LFDQLYCSSFDGSDGEGDSLWVFANIGVFLENLVKFLGNFLENIGKSLK
jgi:hypothetical protein